MQDHTTLKAWQAAQLLAVGAHRLARAHWTPGAAEALDQLRRAALSVQLNIAEGYPWKPAPKWKHHLRIALGSAAETLDTLHHLANIGAVPTTSVFALVTEAERARILLRGLLK